MAMVHSHGLPLIATAVSSLPPLVAAYLHDWAKRDKVKAVVGVDDAAVITLEGPATSSIVVKLSRDDHAISVVQVQGPHRRSVLYHHRFASMEDQMREAHLRVVAFTN